MRVALVSEHASPLAVLGGVDAGGQNVHVAALAASLGRLGDEVVVHTRRDDPALPRRVADAVRALGEVPDAELHVAGGPEADALGADPEARRLRALADDLGVGDR